MSAPLPPYSGPDAICPKCGGTMTSRYMPATTVFTGLAAPDAGCMFRYGGGPEWLFRECSECRYGWPEQCGTAVPRVAAMLAEFHALIGEPFGGSSPADGALRRRLHIGEHDELIEALDAADLVGIAHELADVVYVCYGTAHSLGLPLDAVLAEVHRANVGKIETSTGRDPDGKIIKGPGFVPADVAGVLRDAGADRG